MNIEDPTPHARPAANANIPPAAAGITARTPTARRPRTASRGERVAHRKVGATGLSVAGRGGRPERSGSRERGGRARDDRAKDAPKQDQPAPVSAPVGRQPAG